MPYLSYFSVYQSTLNMEKIYLNFYSLSHLTILSCENGNYGYSGFVKMYVIGRRRRARTPKIYMFLIRTTNHNIKTLEILDHFDLCIPSAVQVYLFVDNFLVFSLSIKNRLFVFDFKRSLNTVRAGDFIYTVQVTVMNAKALYILDFGYPFPTNSQKDLFQIQESNQILHILCPRNFIRKIHLEQKVFNFPKYACLCGHVLLVIYLEEGQNDCRVSPR